MADLSPSQIDRLRVRLVARRVLVTRMEARYLIPGRDSDVDAVCKRIPFRQLAEDGQPLYEYEHILDAMPLTIPGGFVAQKIEAPPVRAIRPAMEDL